MNENTTTQNGTAAAKKELNGFETIVTIPS
jgi:hypothetical protein